MRQIGHVIPVDRRILSLLGAMQMPRRRGVSLWATDAGDCVSRPVRDPGKPGAQPSQGPASFAE
jgi:hypothetical protein